MPPFDVPHQPPVAVLRVATHAALAAMVDRHLAACRRSGTSLALIRIALDGLASVREGAGAAMAEAWLDEAWCRLRRCTRGVDLAVRVGSDELAAILPGASAGAAAVVQARLAGVMLRPWRIRTAHAGVAARTGAAIYPDAGDTGQALVHAAGRARLEASAAVVPRKDAQRSLGTPATASISVSTAAGSAGLTR